MSGKNPLSMTGREQPTNKRKADANRIITTGAKNNRTGTNGTNENRGCPSVFEGRGEGSHKIPVQIWANKVTKNKIPVQFRQINPSKKIP